jgi:hypothetical protein
VEVRGVRRYGWELSVAARRSERPDRRQLRGVLRVKVQCPRGGGEREEERRQRRHRRHLTSPGRGRTSGALGRFPAHARSGLSAKRRPDRQKAVVALSDIVRPRPRVRTCKAGGAVLLCLVLMSSLRFLMWSGSSAPPGAHSDSNKTDDVDLERPHLRRRDDGRLRLRRRAASYRGTAASASTASTRRSTPPGRACADYRCRTVRRRPVAVRGKAGSQRSRLSQPAKPPRSGAGAGGAVALAGCSQAVSVDPVVSLVRPSGGFGRSGRPRR